MTRPIANTIKIANLALTVAVAGCLATGSQAKACAGPERPSLGAAYSPNLAMARLKMMFPGTKAETEVTANDSVNPTIVGLWHNVYSSGGEVVDEGFETYHADGTEMLVDLSPPATDNVCSGTWIQTGAFTYKLNHPSWYFDMDGNLLGMAVIKDSVTLDRDGNSFSGTETVDIYDLDGKLVNHLEGTFKATRIKPV
jgi:hypothetical protein